ncbi:MAG: serpin family protein [Acidimicrobiia bacterium]|nr:serpin family protein [Acidimicrobiia bacterium]
MRGPVATLVALLLLVAACAEGAGPGEIDSTRPAPGVSPSSVTTSAGGVEPVGEPVVLVPSSGVERSTPVGDAPVADLTAGFNNAGFELWRTQPLDGNLVFSPASIGHALLMARAAADETTGTAIDEAFALPAGPAAHQAWNATDQLIAGSADAEGEITIRVADRIWPRVDVTPDQTWVDLLAAEHGATTETLDFAGDPTGSRQIINSWVSDQTEGLIPELLPEGFLDDQTVLVLTDAIYFKAQWQTIFGKYPIVTDAFTLLDGSTVEAEYLRELELADRRGEGDGFVGAEIPYVGGEFSMLVIVPDPGRFEEIRDRIDQNLLEEIDASFTTGPYELVIPKWKSTTQLDLLAWLTEIGAAPGAYPRITPDAFLDGAVHGADITVDEWGTVAAAATALGFDESGPPEPELTVKADRPFLYLIRHRPSGVILFAGQVTNPGP